MHPAWLADHNACCQCPTWPISIGAKCPVLPIPLATSCLTFSNSQREPAVTGIKKKMAVWEPQFPARAFTSCHVSSPFLCHPALSSLFCPSPLVPSLPLPPPLSSRLHCLPSSPLQPSGRPFVFFFLLPLRFPLSAAPPLAHPDQPGLINLSPKPEKPGPPLLCAPLLPKKNSNRIRMPEQGSKSLSVIVAPQWEVPVGALCCQHSRCPPGDICSLG